MKNLTVQELIELEEKGEELTPAQWEFLEYEQMKYIAGGLCCVCNSGCRVEITGCDRLDESYDYECVVCGSEPESIKWKGNKRVIDAYQNEVMEHEFQDSKLLDWASDEYDAREDFESNVRGVML